MKNEEQSGLCGLCEASRDNGRSVSRLGVPSKGGPSKQSVSCNVRIAGTAGFTLPLFMLGMRIDLSSFLRELSEQTNAMQRHRAPVRATARFRR